VTWFCIYKLYIYSAVSSSWIEVSSALGLHATRKGEGGADPVV
jgi:hypothetical protein